MSETAPKPHTGRAAVLNLASAADHLKHEMDSSSDSADLSGDECLSSGENQCEVFFMEDFSERQLQQVLSLFTADFKPVSGLWAEKTAQSSRVKAYKYRNMQLSGATQSMYNSLGQAALLGANEYDYLCGERNPQSNLLIDFFEDNMLEEVGIIDSKDEDFIRPQYKESSSSIHERQQTTSQSDGEDLGIIDLDKQEGSEYDDFDQLDDEKLPVLKNTYSKKNRPNNSKSVAIGSRSQGNVIRIRS
jgi:hypothetical protein